MMHINTGLIVVSWYYTVLAFDPKPARQLHRNSCHRAFLLYSLAWCLHLLIIYPYVHSPGRCGVPRYDAICYYTDFCRSTRDQRGNCSPSLATVGLYCILLSLMSSTAVHLPVCLLARSMLGSKVSCHLLRHCFCVRPGTSAATAAQSILYSLPRFFGPCPRTAKMVDMQFLIASWPERFYLHKTLGKSYDTPTVAQGVPHISFSQDQSNDGCQSDDYDDGC
jgi:hypothetical protein